MFAQVDLPGFLDSRFRGNDRGVAGMTKKA